MPSPTIRAPRQACFLEPYHPDGQYRCGMHTHRSPKVTPSARALHHSGRQDVLFGCDLFQSSQVVKHLSSIQPVVHHTLTQGPGLSHDPGLDTLPLSSLCHIHATKLRVQTFYMFELLTAFQLSVPPVLPSAGFTQITFFSENQDKIDNSSVLL